MPRARMLGGLGLALALAASARAQNGTEAVIAEAQVEVRSAAVEEVAEEHGGSEADCSARRRLWRR